MKWLKHLEVVEMFQFLVSQNTSNGPNHVTVVGLDVINGILPKDKLTAGCE